MSALLRANAGHVPLTTHLPLTPPDQVLLEAPWGPGKPRCPQADEACQHIPSLAKPCLSPDACLLPEAGPPTSQGGHGTLPSPPQGSKPWSTEENRYHEQQHVSLSAPALAPRFGLGMARLQGCAVESQPPVCALGRSLSPLSSQTGLFEESFLLRTVHKGQQGIPSHEGALGGDRTGAALPHQATGAPMAGAGASVVEGRAQEVVRK